MADGLANMGAVLDKTSTAEMKNERRKIKERSKYAILFHEHGGELQ